MSTDASQSSGPPMLLSWLHLEQRRIDPAVAAAAIGSAPDSIRPYLLAAAALLAGEPKRALRTLGSTPAPDRNTGPDTRDGLGMATGAAGSSLLTDGDTGDYAASLRYLATALDHNWFPGDVGGYLADTDLNALATGEVPNPTSAIGRLAAQTIPGLLSLRASAAVPAPGDMMDMLARLIQMTATGPPVSPEPFAASFHAVTGADLQWLIGDAAAAREGLKAAVTTARQDQAALAHAAVMEGDWLAEPQGRPEQLGLFPLRATAPVLVRDGAAAAAKYDAAARGWTLTGSQAGVAAATLRQAHLARLAGDSTKRDALLGRAETFAIAGGATSLALLAQLHGIIDRIAEGDPVDETWADQIVRWAQTNGSTSYARGFVRMLVARTLQWRADGAFLRARRGLRLAQRLASGIAASDEVELVVEQTATQYGQLYRPAGAVMADERLASMLRSLEDAKPPAFLSFARAANEAMDFFLTANRGAHPGLMNLASVRLRQVLAHGHRVADGPDGALRTITDVLTDSVARADLLGRWYSGLELRRDGQSDRALQELEEALTLARDAGDHMVEAAVLFALRRPEEALGVVRTLVTNGQMEPDVAVSMFVRLGSAADAVAVDEGASKEGSPTWERLARDAELDLLREDPEGAIWRAEEALRVFGDRLGRLGRDNLRSAATDLPEVADAYHVAVLAHLARADKVRPEEPASALSHELQALAVSDQARGLALLADDGSVDLSDAGRRAVRRWLRAGSTWAATYEDLAAHLGGPPNVERASVRIDAAELELDSAEEEVERLAPSVLRERSPARLELAAVRANLPEDSVLLAYHAHRDALVGWALTQSTTRVVSQDIKADDLAALAVRAHRAFSSGAAYESHAEDLTQRLLAPFTAELDEHRRVLVAPHSALAMLPFHAFPWGDRFLGSTHDVSYLPSIGLLTRGDAGRAPRLEDGALLVGDPTTDPARGLARLPGTLAEVRAAEAVLPHATVLSREGATKAAIVAQSQHRAVLHLAAHGLFWREAPNLATVYLAGHDQLTVGDLMGLTLAADLVVLSACHTGQGVPTQAGDVVGLTRAALVAGGRHVVVSLWPVDDQAGALVMASFYRHLADGDGVTAALANAQREVQALDSRALAAAYAALPRDGLQPTISSQTSRARGFVTVRPPLASHPYSWAPFIHVGV